MPSIRLGILKFEDIVNIRIPELFKDYLCSKEKANKHEKTKPQKRQRHIMCGYHCDKAVTKNDTREVI